ncbi:hypothetical protein RRSWK_06242 [Rhodopirellula sp. SWK7]|nr:hypothetical protein RRSWK_06242 [Rhodopirellula sp. SWK7]
MRAYRDSVSRTSSFYWLACFHWLTCHALLCLTTLSELDRCFLSRDAE